MNPQDRKTPIALLLFSGLLVAVLSGWFAATEALCTDELFSLTTAGEPVRQMFLLLKSYQPGYFDQPPLLFLLLRFIILFSDAPLALRLPSLIATAAAVGTCCLAAWQRGWPTKFAVAFALLLATHPLVYLQSTFVRMYSLFLLLAVLVYQLLIYMAANRDRSIRVAALLALLFTALIYNHYLGVFVILGAAIVGLIWLIRPGWIGGDRFSGAMILAACLASDILYIPWLEAIGNMLAREGEGAPSELTRSRHALILMHNLGGNFVGFGFLAVGWILLTVFDRARRYWLVGLFLFFLLPISLLALFIPPTRDVADRYFIFSIPVLLAGGINGWLRFAQQSGRARRWFETSLVIAIAALSASYAYSTYRSRFSPIPDWWGGAQIVQTNARDNEIILSGGFLSGEAIVYHLDNPDRYSFIHYVSRPKPFYAACKNPTVVWFVNMAPLPDAYRRVLHHYFPYRIEFVGNRSFSTIQVYAKRPFDIPWQGPAPYRESAPLDRETLRIFTEK